MTTAVATISPVQEVQATLAKMKDQFALTLPKHIAPEKFVSVAQMAIAISPYLANCDRKSLYNEFAKCAQDGLIPDGREATIQAYNEKAKYIPMVAGICKRARNSGEISMMDAQVVYANDEYASWIDEKGPHFKHVRSRGERGEKQLTYAYAIGKDGGVYFEEIDLVQMAQIKAFALKKIKPDLQKYSPWTGAWEPEMERKSAIRRLGKYRLPNSADLDSLFKRDDEEELETIEATKEEAEPKAPTRLQGIVEAEQTTEAEAPAKTAQEAAKDAAGVFPNSKPVAQRAPQAASNQTAKPTAAPAAKPAAAPQKTGSPAVLIAKGSIQDMKVADRETANGTTRRYAIKIEGKFYGTSKKEMADQMQAAFDAQAEVTVNYTEKQEGETLIREVSKLQYEKPAQSISENDVPI